MCVSTALVLSAGCGTDGSTVALATGVSIDDNGTWMDIVHFDGQGNAQTVTTIGSIFRIVIPGQGIVSQHTGIITFDAATGEVLFEGGPHENARGIEADYCGLLSGSGASRASRSGSRPSHRRALAMFRKTSTTSEVGS